MVRRNQAEENYDEYDPTPYKGGYDQAEVYGSVKPADEETAYRPAKFGEDPEEAQVHYGNEKNPYGGPSQGSSYGGQKQTYDRTKPSYEEAQPNRGSGAGYGGRSRRNDEYEAPLAQEPVKEEQESYGRKPAGYRNPTPSYGEEGYGEEEGYRKPKPSYGEGGYGGGEGSRQTYGRPTKSYGEETEEPEEEGGHHSGYGRGRKAHGEEEIEEGGYRSGYGRPQKAYGEEESGYPARPRKGYGEEETDEAQEEGGYRTGYGRTQQGYGDDEGSSEYAADRPRRGRRDAEEYSEEPAEETTRRSFW